jgi:HPt (histidine-containing phosphotransfer) domain-containing protein
MAFETQFSQVALDNGMALWVLPDSLMEFVNNGDAATVAEILVLFRTDAGERLRKLNSAAAVGDRETVRRQAHTLKGSSAQVGALPMAMLCREMEDVAADAPDSELLDLANKAFDCYNRTCLEMPIVN